MSATRSIPSSKSPRSSPSARPDWWSWRRASTTSAPRSYSRASTNICCANLRDNRLFAEEADAVDRSAEMGYAARHRRQPVYIPEHFAEQRPEILARAIRDIQFALLVTALDGEYFASHVPTVLKQANGGFTIEAHVARPNEHWKMLAT